MVGRDRLAHALLDVRQVVGRQWARQQEVVVEAVLDDRADPELGAGEQVQHRFGQHVRGAVAHRPELARGAVVHQLRGAAALRRVEDFLLVRYRDVLRFVTHVDSRESANPSSLQDERSDPPAVPPAFAGPWRLRALWPR